MKGDGRRAVTVVDLQGTLEPSRPREAARPRPAPEPMKTRRQPGAKVRPCLGCGRPRWSTSPADRLHARCRVADAVEHKLVPPDGAA